MQHSTNKAKHSSSNPLMQWSLARFHTDVRALIPNTVSTVLEVGCGEGFSAQAALSSRPLSCYGGDLSAAALAEARLRFPPMHYCVLDATALPFPSASADLVLSLEVLEHLPDPGAALDEFRRVSRRYLLLSVPHEPFFRALRVASGKNLRQWGDHPEHLQHWSLRSFVRLLETRSLRVLRAVSPPPWIWSVVLCEHVSA